MIPEPMSADSTFKEIIEKMFPRRAVLTVKQAQQVLGVSGEHVADLIHEGKIKAFNVAGLNNKTSRESWRIPVDALAAYQEKHSSV